MVIANSERNIHKRAVCTLCVHNKIQIQYVQPPTQSIPHPVTGDHLHVLVDLMILAIFTVMKKKKRVHLLIPLTVDQREHAISIAPTRIVWAMEH